MAIQAKCEKCGEDFLVITKEVEFYKSKDLPLPTMCPAHRLERRMNLRDKKELLGYNCDKCGKDIITAIEPEEGVQIYCKECYQTYMQQNDCILGYSAGYQARMGDNAPAPTETQPAPRPTTESSGEINDPVSW